MPVPRRTAPAHRQHAVDNSKHLALRAIAQREVIVARKRRAREQIEEREEEVETMRREMVRLRKEREDIRGRVEKMLKQIDALVAEG